MLDYQYTDKNHFKFGYDKKNQFQIRSSRNQIFTAEYGRASIATDNWNQSNLFAAEQILKNFSNKKIVICLSGGTDSEVCLKSFHNLKASIEVAIMRFHNGVNEPDFHSALKICKELAIQPKVFELDILKFWQSLEFYEIIDPIRCVSPIIAAQLWLALQVDGVPVIAQGEPHFKKEISKDFDVSIHSYKKSPWYLVESERLCSMYLCFIQRKLPAIPGFFQYIPEQFQAYLQKNPILHNLFASNIPGKLGTRSSKNQIIRQFYPQIKLREKLTGIESIQSKHDEMRMTLTERFSENDANFRIDLPELCQQLGIQDDFSHYFS